MEHRYQPFYHLLCNEAFGLKNVDILQVYKEIREKFRQSLDYGQDGTMGSYMVIPDSYKFRKFYYKVRNIVPSYSCSQYLVFDKMIKSTRMTCVYSFYVSNRENIFALANKQTVLQILAKSCVVRRGPRWGQSVFRREPPKRLTLPSYVYLDKLLSDVIVTISLSIFTWESKWLTSRSILNRILLSADGNCSPTLSQDRWSVLKKIFKDRLCSFPNTVLTEYIFKMKLNLFRKKTLYFKFNTTFRPDFRPTSYYLRSQSSQRKKYSYPELLMYAWEFIATVVFTVRFKKLSEKDFMNAQCHFKLDPKYLMKMSIYKRDSSGD